VGSVHDTGSRREPAYVSLCCALDTADGHVRASSFGDYAQFGESRHTFVSRVREASRLQFFFFSSRRRHTRLVSDWSSDVCSSDLRQDQRGGEQPALTPWPLRQGDDLGTFVFRQRRRGQPGAQIGRNVGLELLERSEERRVGKEGRARGWGGREKKTREDV